MAQLVPVIADGSEGADRQRGHCSLAPTNHEDGPVDVDVALMHENSWPVVQRGGERYLHDIAWYLDRHTNWHPRVVTARGRPRHDQVEDVPVDRTWWTPFDPHGRTARRRPRMAATVAGVTGRRALAALDADVVHAMSPGAALAGVRAGLPTVFTTLGAPDVEFARRSPRRWAVLAAAAEDASAVTAVGRQAADRFADALGRDVVALQPGIRLGAFPCRPEPRTGPPQILFASTVTPRFKGFASVLEALPAVVDEHPDARLGVLGPGDVVGQLEDASPAVRRLRDHVQHDLVPSEEMPARYAAGTVTVLPSVGEAFGLVLTESLASGTPIVASSDGGPAEILAGGEGVVGYSTAPHDPDAIADALLRTIELAAEPTTPAACRTHAQQWGWVEAIGPRHEDLYRDIAA